MKLQNVTTYPAIVGGVLVKAREAKKIDQRTLAQAVGIGQSTWSRIERGDSAFTINQLRKAAERLERTPADILSEADRQKVNLENAGVKVLEEERTSGLGKAGMVVLAGAALVLLLSGRK